MISVFPPEIGSKSWREIEKVSTVFVSMTGGESVFDGVKGTPTTLRSWIIIRRPSENDRGKV
jgi:hypothetical protein